MKELRKIYAVINKLNKGQDYWEDLSSGYTPKEFKSWATKHSNQVKKSLKEFGVTKFETVSKGHFYYSMFAFSEATGWIYLSISDVRYFPLNQILIRTAESNKDYTGGRNQYINLMNEDSFVKDITNIVGGMRNA